MTNFKTYQVAASGPDVHHDALLSNMAVTAFDATDESFVADRLFGVLPVAKQFDHYMIVAKEAFLHVEDGRRAPKTEPRRIEWRVSSDGYFAHNYALAAEYALEDVANADSVFRLRERATNLVTLNLRRGQEQRIANICTSISNVGSGVLLAGSNKWSDYVNSDPLGDVSSGTAFIHSQTGLRANAMVLDFDTYEIVRKHPDILDLYKHTQGGVLTTANVAAAFGVDNLWIADGIQENALEGGATSLTNIWGHMALLARVAPASALNTATFGMRFRWTDPALPGPFAAFWDRVNQAGSRKVEIVEAGYFQDEKVIARDLAYLIGSTL